MVLVKALSEVEEGFKMFFLHRLAERNKCLNFVDKAQKAQ
jgi:hypothetical protein